MAYAAIELRDPEQIDVDTVSASRRGSMVNWLWRNGIRVTNDWTDEQIERAFSGASHLVRLAEVEIKERTDDVDPD